MVRPPRKPAKPNSDRLPTSSSDEQNSGYRAPVRLRGRAPISDRPPMRPPPNLSDAIAALYSEPSRDTLKRDVQSHTQMNIDIARETVERAPLTPDEKASIMRAILGSLPQEYWPQPPVSTTPVEPPPLPTKAPMLWKEAREKGIKVDPHIFTHLYYRKWIGHGLTRQHLNRLDPDLYRALSVWEHRHPQDRIAAIPTLAEVLDQRIAKLSEEFTADELRKLGSTLQTRHRRAKK